MLKKQSYKKNSLQEYLAFLVWNKQNTIFAKQTLAVVLSNTGNDKCLDIYEELLEEMYPNLKDLKIAKDSRAKEELEDWLGKKKIMIEATNAHRYIQV